MTGMHQYTMTLTVVAYLKCLVKLLMDEMLSKCSKNLLAFCKLWNFVQSTILLHTLHCCLQIKESAPMISGTGLVYLPPASTLSITKATEL